MEQVMHRLGIRGLPPVSAPTQQAGMPLIHTLPRLLKKCGTALRCAGVMLLAGHAGVCTGSLAQDDAAQVVPVEQGAVIEGAVSAAQGTATAEGVLSAAQGTATEKPAFAAVQAIWKEQEIDFNFQSFTTFYSCSSLEDRIEYIFRGLGAQVTARVRDIACPFSVARMPRVHIHLRSPVEATPAALAEYEKGHSKRVLVARVRGEQAEESAEMARFPAVWKTVTLSRGPLGLDSGDCELVRELRRKVFSKLAVRIVQDDTRCSSNLSVPRRLRLQMEALMEQPSPDVQDVEDQRPES
ncbi:hypothetical protein ACG33_06245 [Steroidobacter denitrificans]|uniref:Uncharacterized protein n=2 Tax=Steroidobacter denitrificans TaxID=465721 RepID=A0A127FAP8_STEDE|nr:hypothetical protein ACG33_06245 [Steroidobacter denitrificans]